eukprot:g1597.t1
MTSLIETGSAAIPKKYHETLGKILFTEEMIEKRITEMAAQISKDYEGEEILIVGLLKGAILFVADLVRKLTVPSSINFIIASSYGHGVNIDVDPKGKHVLIVEDLIDTGNTLAWVKKHFESKEVASFKLCCLLDKKARRTANVDVDYVGFDCPDEFVVGYGMDFAEHYRTLPFVGVLKPEAYM